MIAAGTSLVVVSIDVNDLKPVNDREGHDAGDRLLRAVAHALLEASEPLQGSLAARTGGDEFCLIVPTADPSAVEKRVRRFMASVIQLPHPPGVSCGMASSQGGVKAARLLFSAADRAMYAAKKQQQHSQPHHVTVATD
jgi:diguanylate cyclase (GGDEF)-like protein